MPSYDNPQSVSYDFAAVDFGAGNSAFAIKPPPKLNNGNIKDIHVAVSETFNQVTTPGFVRIGTVADPDKYAELNMGAAAITDAYNLVNTPLEKPRLIDLDADAITQVEVTFVAPTGGTPAGIGNVTIAIDWF